MAADLTIDDLDLRWTLRSEPRWTPEVGYQGLTFSVQMANSALRELVVEFPFPGEKPTGYVKSFDRPDVLPASIEAAVRLAINAGWKPLSRGRSFHFKVPDDEQ